MPRFLLVLVLFLIAGAGAANAQMFAYEPNRTGPISSLSVGAYLTSFTYKGVTQGNTSFEFDNPALAIRFTRPGVDLHIIYGWNGGETEDRKLIEASLDAWSGILLTGRSATRVYLPLALHSGYRAIGSDLSTNQAVELFNFTTLGLGTGLVLERRFGNDLQLQARAITVVGLALRSFEGFAGDTRLFDADVDLNFLRLFGRYGITLSYGFRWQEWDLNAERFLEITNADAFDYSGTMHMFRVGLNW